MNSKTSPSARLASQANERLARIGGTVAAGSFVCPMCLRLLPVAKASEGHFPAQNVRAEVHGVELQCADCNNGIGGSYEKVGADFLEHIRTVTWRRPDGKGTFLETRAKLRNDEVQDAVAVDVLTSKRAKSRGRLGRARTGLDRVLAGMPEPRAIAVSVARPTDEAAKRALVAWSFLELFRYAGYPYAASPGAAFVRRVILDPNAPLPAGIFFQKAAVELPLAAPEPVVVVRREGQEIAEAVGLGVMWGTVVAVMPFGSDEDEGAWDRVAELLELDQLVTTDNVPLRRLHSDMGAELVGTVELRDPASGVSRSVTVDLAANEVADLANGRSPYRLAPPKGHGWRPAMETEHEFITLEGDPPPLRTEHWGQRVLAMGGGNLPEIVAKVLEEIPTVPRPVPSPAPLAMVKTTDGWRATLRMQPDDISGEGRSPGVAVAVLLATVERDLAIEGLVAESVAEGPRRPVDAGRTEARSRRRDRSGA